MIDFRVETFIQVCKYMNYTKAAKALHITQPAVSQHIRYMEQEYGVTLFQFQGKICDRLFFVYGSRIKCF